MRRLPVAVLVLLSGCAVGLPASGQTAKCDASGVCRVDLPSAAPTITAPASIPPIAQPPQPAGNRTILRCITPADYCEIAVDQPVQYGDACACRNDDGQVFQGVFGSVPGRTR